ncbi:MAG: arginine repressor [Velocimicrobium sp.]
MKVKDTVSAKDANNLKITRQEAIINLIENEHVGTQNELLKRLEDAGFVVTQATISRDIRELRLIKAANPGGSYHYEISKSNDNSLDSNKFYSIFKAGVNKVDYANNLVVVKCFTGMAQAVCATMDGMDWPGIVGTVSGDDTILVVMRNEQSAKDLVQKLKEIR